MTPFYATSHPERFSLSFEARSFIGRHVFSSIPKRANGILNLGCGAVPHECCCNADFFRFGSLNWLRRLMGKVPIKRIEWELDLRFPLNCPDSYFDGAFCEHTLEHIDIWHTRALLKEIHRVLKPNSLFRVTVPDISLYIAYYNGQITSPEFEQWNTKGEAIWSVAHNWGHRCVYDFDLMRNLLLEAGFCKVDRRSFGVGSDTRLILDSRGRAWESLYVEAQRS